MTLNISAHGDRQGRVKNKHLNKMEKMNNDSFGKFQNDQIESLASIKGGLVVGDTSTSLCKTTETTFDTDSTSNGENVADKRCSGNFA
jgi:hypothetical protein